MLKIILVDDERPALELLDRMLSENPAVEVVGTFQKPSEALSNIALLKPDAVYLDIEMPIMNGIELASKIYDIDPGVEIIFLTAYDSYALQAFEVNALDYVLKPVMEERLEKSIERLCKRKAVQKETENAVNDKLIVKMLGGFKLVKENNQTIKWITSKSEELFAFLLLNNSAVSKWVIMDTLWPEVEPKKAEQNLYTTIFRLKKTLKDNGLNIVIEADKGTYKLLVSSCINWDVKLLLDAYKSNDKERLKTTIDLYKGDLLSEKDYLWCYELRNKLLKCYKHMTLNLIEIYLAEEEYQECLDLIQEVTGNTGFDEDIINKLKKILELKPDYTVLKRARKMIKEISI